MYAKGNLHGNGGKLVDYILSGGPGERVEYGDARGLDFFADDPRDAAEIMDRMAGVITNAEKPWFHTQTRLPADERLTRAQWEQVVEREEKVLGFTGLPRIWSLHVNEADGERHLHIAWYRVDVEQERAIDPGLFKNKLKLEVARYLEKQLGLRRISNERKPEDRARYANRGEVEESRRLGTDVREIRTAILDSFERSDSGRAFKAALAAQGFELANGDRRDCFVVIDQAGGQHALNKRLTGLTLEQTRQRLSDLDRAQLPSVEQAQEMQAERLAAREAAREARQAQGNMRGADGPEKAAAPSDGRERGRQAPSERNGAEAARGRFANLTAEAAIKARPLGQTAGEIRMAWRITRTGQQFAAEIEARGFTLVHISREQAAASERARAFAKAAGRRNRALKEGFAVVDQRGTATRIDQRVTGDQWEEIQKRLGGIERGELTSLADARAIMRERNRAEFRAKKEADRAEQRIKEPVGKTAGKIREAWNAPRGADAAKDAAQLEQALAARGFKLARVTAEEAYASERIAALAKEADRHAPIYRDGEIVIVNGFGNVYRIDERTTGERRPQIDARLAGIDAGGLASVAETKATHAKAQREAWIKKRRPASAIENRIAQCAEQAARLGANVVRDRETGRVLSRAEALADRLKPAEERRGESIKILGKAAFAAHLAEEGIALVRVTEQDVKALDALRQDEQLARTVSATEGEARRQHHFAEVKAGEIAAVTRAGDVHRINLGKAGDAGKHLPEPLPDVVTARAAFESERAATDKIWQQHRETVTAEREDRAAQREARRHSAGDARTARSLLRTGERHLFKSARAATSAASKLIVALGDKVLGLFDFGIGASKPPPKQEAERMHRAAEEQQQQADDLAAYADRAERLDDILRQVARDDAERLRQRRERGDYDEVDRGRERER